MKDSWFPCLSFYFLECQPFVSIGQKDDAAIFESVLLQYVLHESESGITIHYIDEHYDEGSTVFQAKCPVLPGDTPADVAKKVHALEYEWFPKIIERVVNSL